MIFVSITHLLIKVHTKSFLWPSRFYKVDAPEEARLPWIIKEVYSRQSLFSIVPLFMWLNNTYIWSDIVISGSSASRWKSVAWASSPTNLNPILLGIVVSKARFQLSWNSVYRTAVLDLHAHLGRAIFNCVMDNFENLLNFLTIHINKK